MTQAQTRQIETHSLQLKFCVISKWYSCNLLSFRATGTFHEKSLPDGSNSSEMGHMFKNSHAFVGIVTLLQSLITITFL